MARKLAGILLETRPVAHGWPSASASIWRTIPTDTEFPATSLARAGRRSRRRPSEALARLAAPSPNGMRSGWQDGFAPIRDAWLARAAGLGQRIRARLPDRETAGRVRRHRRRRRAAAERQAPGPRAIAAGEVFFG